MFFNHFTFVVHDVVYARPVLYKGVGGGAEDDGSSLDTKKIDFLRCVFDTAAVSTF